MEKEFIPYEQALALKELGFDEPCMYAWCITREHRVEYDGKMSLKTDGNPFGQFYKGKSFNLNYNPNKNRIQCSAPLYQQAFRWFREKYNLFGCIDLQYSNPAHWYIRVDDIIKNDFVYHSEDYHIKYKTYEEAENACIDKLIELIYV